ncbi:MAG: branched-chain amino acid ABC transporter permease [Rhodospirillales bacterium]|nr:branched-chain amino acid ABC transporter permease [Rhodospirillales bacterium]
MVPESSSLSSSESLWPALAATAGTALFAVVFMWAETEVYVLAVIVAGAASAWTARRFGVYARAARLFAVRENVLDWGAVAGLLVLLAAFHEEHFPLLMTATVLLYLVACLGLNIQFGYAGVLNFAAAAFFGVGGYTAAVLVRHTGIPHPIVLLIGGAMAALIGLVLVLPVLRTRGHYAAVITIAFAILFRTFLEVNDALGGPQGLKLPALQVFGWNFNRNFEIAGIGLSFYVNYVLLALALAVVAFALTRRLERSWIGLTLDAVRLDETAAACFGVHLARWKALSFTLGNFMAGVAGAVYALMLGFIAPSNFTFGDSLIMVSIVLLGGIGNPWGVVLASAIVVVLPEKLQLIQEYRFILYATMVILVLLFRPEGLLPRRLRVYFPGWSPK